MRTVRVLVALALAASAAAVIAPSAATAADPQNEFTIDGTSAGAGFDVDDVFTGSQVATTVGADNASIEFDGSSADPSPITGFGKATLTATAGSLSQTEYQIGTSPVSFEVDRGSAPCPAKAGTVDVIELATDAGTGVITTFAADYSITCVSGQQLAGVLRLNSATDFAAASASPKNWDFGTQLANNDNYAGWAKAFTFTNSGTIPVTYGLAKILPTSHAGAYSIRNNCLNTTIQPGQDCTVTVVPHPHAVGASPSVSTLALATTAPTGFRTRVVQLQMQGSNITDIFARPGPGHIALSWGRLEQPIGAIVTGWQVYRGTSSTNLSALRRTSVRHLDDTAVSTSRAYYYAVAPIYGGSAGERTPIVAARAWPKYAPGMYHGLATPRRFVSAHKVSAGHPYRLRIDGSHGIPGGHVSAVAVEVLAQHATKNTSLTLYPAGTARPTQPDLRENRGATRSNFAIVRVGSGGAIWVANTHGSAAVTVDVSGYYSAAGLSSSHGMGSAYLTYTRPGTILDTKAWGLPPLPHGYYIDAPVNFSTSDTPHVRSFAVQITAYGSKGSGTITAFASNGRPSSTQVLAYGPNSTSTNVAIVTAGRLDVGGRGYPSIALLNRGAKPVHLIMTILGFYDNDYFVYGEHYVPTAPQHLGVKNPMYAGSTRTLAAGYKHADVWTTSLNLHIAATEPSKSTTLKLWPTISGVRAPAHGQMRAQAHVNSVTSTVAALGVGNKIHMSNSAGRVTVGVWSFGRFDAFPQPTRRNYASTDAAVTFARPTAPGPARVPHRAVALR